MRRSVTGASYSKTRELLAGKGSFSRDSSRMLLKSSSVVQRQLWLLHQNDGQTDKPKMTKSQAYDQARKEFYELRLLEDVQRRVAIEEALATGAYFGKSLLDIGMGLEDQEFERWKARAEKESELMKQRQASMYTGEPDPTPGSDGDGLEAALTLDDSST